MSTEELPLASSSQTEQGQQAIPPTNVDDSEQPPENEDENSTATMTMENRKAKMEQLRARMVRSIYLLCSSPVLIIPFVEDVHESKPAITR